MIRHAASSLVLACLCLSGSCAGAAGQETEQNYFIRPSEVAVPEGLKWGEYRRTIQPFENWTLICDENLKKMKKICNISQSIIDRNNVQIFSWSLAATEAGEPLMIVRVPTSVDRKSAVSVAFPGRSKPVSVKLDGCDDKVCIGMLPVGPITREHIAKASEVTFTYATDQGGKVRVAAPLKGISQALAAIR